MSSTNRSKAREEHVADYYVTPINDINLFLKELEITYGYQLNFGKILDPCAGGDSVNEMSYPKAISQYNEKIETIDIREDSRANIKGNYLEIDCKNKYDVIITNPPFFIAQEIISKAIDDIKCGGIVVMLLRLNYFGSDIRQPFWKANMPKYTFVHHKRIGFIPESRKTDSIEYMHCIWEKGYKKNTTELRII